LAHPARQLKPFPETTPMKASQFTSHARSQRGVVLPIALIMLVIISFAGLLAARNSATHEQFSNNMRTTQGARQLAEEALRYCEKVAMDSAQGGTAFETADKNKIKTTEIASESADDLQDGEWNTLANWVSDTTAIEVTPSFGDDVSDAAKTKQNANKPKCIVQKMVGDRFVVTARGLSADAEVDDTSGALTSGTEVWLQSILTPRIPLVSANGGAGNDTGL
jgi:type IV pilus assembly protein PilX